MNIASKTYHIAWNEGRTVGVICEDPQMAYELRKGASNCLGIVTGDFCEAWGDMTANDACTIETVTMAKVSDLASKSFPSVLGGTALGLIDEAEREANWIPITRMGCAFEEELDVNAKPGSLNQYRHRPINFTGRVEEEWIMGAAPSPPVSRKCVICNGSGECTGPYRTCGACNGSGVMR